MIWQRKSLVRNLTNEYGVPGIILGVYGTVLPEDLSHAEIKQQLGMGGDYTAAVEAFIESVD